MVVAVVASLGYGPVYSLPVAYALFYGVTFTKLMGITGSHSEIGGCDRNGKCACYPLNLNGCGLKGIHTNFKDQVYTVTIILGKKLHRNCKFMTGIIQQTALPYSL